MKSKRVGEFASVKTKVRATSTCACLNWPWYNFISSYGWREDAKSAGYQITGHELCR